MSAHEPLFDECALYTYDAFWREVFANCAKGKFPRGVSYNKTRRALYVRRAGGSSSETVHLPDTAPEVFCTMMAVFRQKLGIQSPGDQATARSEVEQRRPGADPIDSWKALPRYLKDDYMSQYVAKIASEHGLSARQAQTTLAFIENALQAKRVSPDSVEFDGRRICKIAGLVYDQGAGRFRLEAAPSDDYIPERPEPPGKEPNRFLKLVDDYLKNLLSRFQHTPPL